MPVTQFLPGRAPRPENASTLISSGELPRTEQKSQPRAPGQTEQRETGNGTQRSRAAAPDRRNPALAGPDGKDVGGWEAYRRWLSRVNLPDKRRIAMDPSLYTWKG